MIEVQDAQGVGFAGTGMAARPDGTWNIEESAAVDPGQFRIVAACATSDGGGFAYETAQVTVP